MSSETSVQALRIYSVLAVAYVASQFFRVSNAVIAPELMTSLSIGPEAMGFITGVFFLAFGVMQLPTGILLDRFGPRITMSSLLAIAGAGSALFALGETEAELAIARALIGTGCAAGLMGALVTISRWYPPERFAQMSSLVFTIGGIGILLATTPLAALTEAIGWRGAFWLMSALTVGLAALLWVVVRDAPDSADAPRAAEGVAEIWQGLKDVLANRGIWHCCALQFVNYATVLSIVGLWAGPYMNDVHGLDGVVRGNVLLAINLCTLAGVMGYTAVERWVGSRKWTIIGGSTLSAATLLVLALVPDLPLVGAVLLLGFFGVVSAIVMLIHSHARAMLPDHLVGRGLTLQNLSVFIGVSLIQSASGFIVGAHDIVDAASAETAYRAVFAFLAGATVLATLLYAPIRDVKPTAAR